MLKSLTLNERWHEQIFRNGYDLHLTNQFYKDKLDA